MPMPPASAATTTGITDLRPRYRLARGTRRGRDERIDIDGRPGARETLGDLTRALDAQPLLFGDERIQFGSVAGQVVAEHVHVFAAMDGRDLDAGDELEAPLARSCASGGFARPRVVIGHADDAQAGAYAPVDELLRSAAAIGGSRVKVKIDYRAHCTPPGLTKPCRSR